MSKELNDMFLKADGLGLSIRELSNLLGIPESRVYNWKNKRGQPKAADLKLITNWLEGVKDAPVIKVQDAKPFEGQELKALTDALLDHYSTSIARLEKRSPLDVQREILTKAMQNLKEG